MYIYSVSGVFFRAQTGTRLPYKAVVSSPNEERAVETALLKIEQTLGFARHYSARAVVIGVTGDANPQVYSYGIDLPLIERFFNNV